MSTQTAHIRQALFGEGQSDWRWHMAIGLLAFQAVFIFWLIAEPGGEQAVLWFDDISLAAGAGVATICTGLVAWTKWGSQTGYAWAMLSAGLAMMTFGEVAWGMQELALDKEVPFPSVADVGYLGVYPFVFIGLLMMPHAPIQGLRRVKLSIDILIAVAALALVSVYLVLSGLIENANGSTLSTAISLAYPICDIGLLFAVVVLLARTGTGLSGTIYACLGVGFLALAFSDSSYTYLTSVEDYSTGSYVDIGWMLSYVLIACAALIALSPRIPFERVRHESHSLQAWQSIFLYIPIIPLAAVHIAAFAGGQENSRDLLVGAGTVTVFGMVLARQALSTFETAQLNRELAEHANALSDKLLDKRLNTVRESPKSGGQFQEPQRDWPD